eukprot:3527620-Prorocentrum_lima.AAC.1
MQISDISHTATFSLTLLSITWLLTLHSFITSPRPRIHCFPCALAPVLAFMILHLTHVLLRPVFM